VRRQDGPGTEKTWVLRTDMMLNPTTRTCSHKGAFHAAPQIHTGPVVPDHTLRPWERAWGLDRACGMPHTTAMGVGRSVMAPLFSHPEQVDVTCVVASGEVRMCHALCSSRPAATAAHTPRAQRSNLTAPTTFTAQPPHLQLPHLVLWCPDYDTPAQLKAKAVCCWVS